MGNIFKRQTDAENLMSTFTNSKVVTREVRIVSKMVEKKKRKYFLTYYQCIKKN